MMRRSFLSFLLIASLFLLIPSSSQAAYQCPPAGPLGIRLIPCDCSGPQGKDDAKCGLDDALEVGVNLSKFILGMLGSVTLVIFMYGGVVWLTSGGNAQRVEYGRNIFEGALVGLMIVLASYVIVNFAITALLGGQIGEEPRIFPNTNSQAPFEIPRQ